MKRGGWGVGEAVHNRIIQFPFVFPGTRLKQGGKRLQRASQLPTRFLAIYNGCVGKYRGDQSRSLP